MAKTIIHIGTHKTGSTYIQSFLSVNRDILNEQGIDYPSVAGQATRKAHSWLAEHFRSNNQAQMQISSSAPVIVISSENFWRCNEHGIRRIREELGHAVIICYFREPISHLVSMWKQLLRGKKSARPLCDHIDKATSNLKASAISMYHYDAMEDLWRNYFPDCAFLPYQTMDGRDLLESFFNWAGVPLQRDERFVYPEKVNASMADEISFMLYRLNKLLQEERISERQRDAYAKRIMRGTSPIGESFRHDVNEWSEFETSTFVKAFVDRNPRWANTLNIHPTAIRFPVGNRGGDARVLDLAKAMLRA